MDWKSLMDDPTTAAIVIAALGTVGGGLALIWKALVAAIVRALDQLAPGHTGDDHDLVAKVHRHEGRGKVESMMLTMAPHVVIEREVRKRGSQVPPGGDE